MEDIARQLAAHFKSIGMTQTSVARQLGVSQAYIQRLFSGASPFGKKQAQRFEEVFGISSSWLLTGQGPMMASERDASPASVSEQPQAESVDSLTATIEEQRKRLEEIERMLAKLIETTEEKERQYLAIISSLTQK